jgi:surfactin synthase thioesterase subunit
MTTPWLTRFAARPSATHRLFCFSYAGGGAAIYRPWALGMPAHVEVAAVMLPGRESRLREAPATSMGELLQGLLPALLPQLGRPFAFFGHSMGALVAYETARALQRRGAPAPAKLLLSGRRAPHLPETDPPLHHLDDDAFVAEIDRRYKGIPAEILEHRELLEILLPGLRADMTVIETHRHDAGATFAGAITVYGGVDDARAPREHLLAWQQHTEYPLGVRQFAGGHFYFNEPGARDALIGAVAAEVSGIPAAEARPAWA